ncbi:MAG: hypothetical protein JST89_17800 [Cyanobacteria bacterium SZAS-4]|nr:hypothetical protein [Cyanobacteria bacterium SZAS-4]
MSAEYDKLDIKKLTTAAEGGQGCAIRDAITNLGFEERFKALKEIQAQNEKNRKDDPSLPYLKAEGWTNRAANFLANSDTHLHMTAVGLKPKGELFSDFDSSSEIYYDTLNTSQGTHKDVCRKLDKY